MKPLAGLFRANDSLISRLPHNRLPKRWTLASHLSPELNTSVTNKKACLHQTDALSTHVFGQTPGLFFFQYPEPAPAPGRSCSPFTHTGIFYQKSRPFPLSDDNFFRLQAIKKAANAAFYHSSCHHNQNLCVIPNWTPVIESLAAPLLLYTEPTYSLLLSTYTTLA